MASALFATGVLASAQGQSTPPDTTHEAMVLDSYGNRVPLSSISVQKGLERGGGSECMSGFFHLVFVDPPGSGFNHADPVIGAELRAVACQVFSDLSVLIQPANSPYPNYPATPVVNIKVSSAAVGPNHYGSGGQYLSLARTYLDQPMQGVFDGQVWRTINGGIDAWWAEQIVLAGSGGNYYPPSQLPDVFFHGYVSIDLTTIPLTGPGQHWYWGQGTPPASPVIDLYGALSHAAMHALGVQSSVRPNGEGPVAAPALYTRFDAHLSALGTPFLASPWACGSVSPNLAADLVTPCGGQPPYPVSFSGASAGAIPLFSHDPGGNGFIIGLDHIDQSCSGHPEWLMANGLPQAPLVKNRIPSLDEAKMLCDLGYHTTGAYGTNAAWAGTVSTALGTCGMRLAGVDDIFVQGTTDFYTCLQNQSIQIGDFLLNDEDQTSGSTPSGFTCPQVIFPTGAASGTVSTVSTTTLQYQPAAGYVGWAVLRYFPFSHGIRGGEAHIYIKVEGGMSGCMTPLPVCNIVSAGDFEGLSIEQTPFFGQFAFLNETFPYSDLVLPVDPIYTQVSEWGNANTPDVVGWNGTTWVGFPYDGQPDQISCRYPDGTISIVQRPPSHNGLPNARYVGIGAARTQAPPMMDNQEALMFELCRDLVPGQQYELSYWAMDPCQAGVQLEFHMLPHRPCSPYEGTTDITGGVNNCGGATFTNQMTLAQQLGGNGWVQYSTTFTFPVGAVASNWLVVTILPQDPVGTLPLEDYALLDDIEVHPIVSATASVTDACNGPLSGSISLNVNYYPGSYAIAWSNGATTASISGLMMGDYTVTITDTQMGCPAFTATYHVDGCCSAALVIPDGTLSSSLPGTLMGTVSIEGQLIVDQPLTFSNAVVYMDPGAGISVQNNQSLNVLASTITSCNGVMWKSITLQYGAMLKVEQSTLNDGEAAILALDGSFVKLKDNVFHNNRVALQVPMVSGVNTNNVVISSVNNTFNSNSPMPVTYPGQTTTVGSRGYAAMEIWKVPLVELNQGWNMFNELGNGIIVRHGDMVVENCSFQHIQPDPVYASLQGNGAGVNAAAKNYNKLVQTGSLVNGQLPFEDCRWGIYTSRMNVYSSANTMLQVGTAYYVEKSNSRVVHLYDNVLDTRQDAIQLFFNDGADKLIVENNVITFANEPPPGQQTKGYAAIRVSENNGENPYSVIRNNDVTYRAGVTTAKWGAYLISARNYQVTGNWFTMTSNSYNDAGITLTGCMIGNVSCNNIKGAANSYPVLRQAAIRVVKSQRILVSCNEMDLTTNGMLFSGECYGNEVRGNNIRHHKWGLHLDGTAIIGMQDHRGNLWFEPPQAGGEGAWYEDPNNTNNPYSFPFYYTPELILGGNAQPPTWEPNYWFQSLEGANYNCSDDGGQVYCGTIKRWGADTTLQVGLDSKIVGDSLENDPYTQQTQWTLRGDLYKKLAGAPALRDSLAVLEDFYLSLQDQATGQLKAVEGDRGALSLVDSTVAAQLQGNQQQIGYNLELVKLAMSQLEADTLSAAGRQNLLNEITGYQAAIQALVDYNTNIMDLARTSKVLSADSVKAANANVATTEWMDLNTKQVNEIYLSTIGSEVDTFTTAQVNALYSIADQCPMVGGEAVFRARALYALVNNEQDFDDPLLCLQQGIIVKSLKPQDTGVGQATVVPNPAMNAATVVLQEELDNPVVFVVFNAIGAVVLREEVPAKSIEWPFSTASLPPTFYYYQVHGASGMIAEGKLAVIR